ncbi:MAG: PGF-pre-PGF domain-containing protein, partial [Candidatus Aenigmarchaeota archaeon]|nr:PGF-pre-PGF domain-containing protein [Candidatus Aenigmarchaeota archaeon]
AGATNRTLTNTNSNQYQINTSPALLGCTADAACTIRFFATDNANNTNYSATTSITTDNINPSVGNLSLNVSSSKQNNSIRINVTVDDTNVNNNWTFVSGDGGATNRTAANTGTNNFQLNSTPFNIGCSPDAACTIRIFAVDNANNTNGSVTATLTVDDTAPTVQPVGYTNATQKRNNQQLTLNVQVSDSGAGLAGTCFIWANSATANNTVSVSSGWCNSTSINLTGASDGNQTLYILLNDTLGNTKVNNSFAVWIETTMPAALAFVTPTPAATANLSQSFIALNLTFTESYTSYCIFEFAGVSSENFTNTSSALGSDRQCFYNKTGLADGNYTIRIYVNDTFGNINATSTRLIKLDTIGPSISFSCTPTEVSRTQTITCSCSATDNLTGVSGGVSFAANPSTIDIGTFSTACTATDYAGNTASSTTSYAVTAAGGFSSGGGGGTVSTASSGTKVSYSFSSIEPSKPAEIKLETKNVGIDNIIIKTDTTATGVSLDVTKLDSKPAAASSLTATSYNYIEIKAENLPKASITVDFKVEKSWITANNIEKNTISLYRYSTSWNKMDTKIVKEDATYAYLQSSLTGFSIFSIAGETKKAECSTGAKRCAGNNVEQCSSEDKWVVTEACTNGCDTSSGACITPPPQPQKPEEEQEVPQPPQPPVEVETTAYSSQQTIFTIIALLIGLLAVLFLIKTKAKGKQKAQPRKNMFGF